MENSYDHYLQTLNIYSPKMTERQKLIMRVARIFEECELEIPPDFEAEVNRCIERWRSTGRFKSSIRVAQENGYIDTISHELLARGLPPQFFYLALQESDMNPYAMGPHHSQRLRERHVAVHPRDSGEIRPFILDRCLISLDPADERHNYKKATTAAAQYLLDLYSTDAQASGLLVMACYNWGEKSVLPLVQSLLANPREPIRSSYLHLSDLDTARRDPVLENREVRAFDPPQLANWLEKRQFGS
jgi:membrane-bound lytic murein transglycosylase D